MRIYISLDAEGCSQLVKFSQVEPESGEYEACRTMMLHDVNCIIQAARSAGADYIFVCDAHEQGVNLPVTGVDADAVLRGTGSPFSMMAGIQEGFDGAFFAGYHARNGSLGVMSHTYYPNSVEAVLFDGKPVSEFEINAALASYYNIPAGLITGDDQACSQAAISCPWIVRGEVKKAIGHSSAICYHQKKCDAILIQAAQEAVEKIKSGIIQCAPIPDTLEVIFQSTKQAKKALTIGENVIDHGERHIQICGNNYKEKFQMMIAAMEQADA